MFVKFKIVPKLDWYILERLSGSLLRSAFLTTNTRLIFPYTLQGGRDSWVGIAAVCNFHGPWPGTLWTTELARPSRPPWDPPSFLYSLYRISFRARGADHPPTSSAEVKERVELYLYSPLGIHGLLQSRVWLITFDKKTLLFRIKSACRTSNVTRRSNTSSLKNTCSKINNTFQRSCEIGFYISLMCIFAWSASPY